MKRVYENANDLHVRRTYIYKKGAEIKAYADTEGNVQLTTSQLTDLYLKGAVILDTDVMYMPVSLKVSGNTATVTYVTTDSVATTAKLATLVSKADA